MTKPIWEYSENRQRATMQHIAQAITELRNVAGACGRCRLRQATHWIGSARAACCSRCAADWAALTAVERLQARAAFGGGR